MSVPATVPPAPAAGVDGWRRPSLAVVHATVFLDLLGFGIILPMLPFYAERFGASGLWVGALLTAYSAAQLAGAPIMGRLSDRIGRKPVLVASLAGSALSLTLTGLAGSLAGLIAARAMAGLFGGSISAAQAYVADVTPPERRAHAMGMLGASIGMGFILGPALGSLLSRHGFSTAAFVAAALAATSGLLALAVLRESLPPALRGRRRTSRLEALLGALGVGPGRAPSATTTAGILASWFLSTFAFVTMESTFALLGERRFGLDPRQLGLVFAFSGVVMVIVQGGLVGRLGRRWGERRLAAAGAVVVAIALAALPLTSSLVPALLVLSGMAAGQGLLGPSLSALLSSESPADERGGMLGLGHSMAAAARAGGPITAGFLFDRGMALPYAAAAVAALCIPVLLQVGVRSRGPDLDSPRETLRAGRQTTLSEAGARARRREGSALP